MKFEVILKADLPWLCEAVREAESISIKNSVLLSRLNGLTHSRRRKKHFTGSNITWPSQLLTFSEGEWTPPPTLKRLSDTNLLRSIHLPFVDLPLAAVPGELEKTNQPARRHTEYLPEAGAPISKTVCLLRGR